MSDDFKRRIKLMSHHELNWKTNEKNKPDKLNRHQIIKNSTLYCFYFFGINQFTTVSNAAGFASSEDICGVKKY